jgi:flagellar hook-associated protein 3 FlgL
MDRVTTASTYSSVINNLMAAEVQQSQADQEVSTGKVADDLSGFGMNAEALTAAQTLLTHVNGYVQTSSTLTNVLDAQDTALTQISGAGTNARQAIAQALATGSAQGLMTSLQSYFGQAVDGLNTQYNGQYLFAGSKVTTAPVAAQTLSDLTSPPPNGVFQNDQLATTSQLNESTTVQSGMLASNVGGPLFNAFQSMEAFDQGANGPLTGTLSQTQITFLQGMLQTFDAANQGLTDTQAQNGLLQNQVSDSLTTQQQRQTTLQNIIGSMTDADMAKASMQLSQAQTAVQASARIFSSLQNTSLLNYLSPTSTGG